MTQLPSALETLESYIEQIWDPKAKDMRLLRERILSGPLVQFFREDSSPSIPLRTVHNPEISVAVTPTARHTLKCDALPLSTDIELSNTDSYTLWFPAELTNLDYIRRILDLLQDGLVVFVNAIKERHPSASWTPEQNQGCDAHFFLKWLIKNLPVWSMQVGVDQHSIEPSLKYLFGVRNSFAHQNESVSHGKKGMFKMASKKNVMECFDRAGQLLLIFGGILGQNKIEFVQRNIRNLSEFFNSHALLKKQRKLDQRNVRYIIFLALLFSMIFTDADIFPVIVCN
jgi:hypothetical protein